MSTTSILDVRLLGPVIIASHHSQLKLPRKIERTILYYLAVENRPISRSALIDLLWPDAQQVDPRGALRTALSRLRRTLPEPGLVITQLDQVALDTERCFVDVLKFQSSYQSLRGVLLALSNHTPLPVQIGNQIKDALELWRGGQLIQGDDLSSYPEIDRWRQSQQRTLALQRDFLMRRLAEHYQSSGQLEMGLDLFLQLGRINFQDVSSHLSVIDILAKMGRQGEALQYCDALEVIFERELNAPLPEDFIKHCQSVQMQAQNHVLQSRMAWPLPTSLNPPLVGRAQPLSQLRQAYFRGGVVRIQGQMGVGKSRLVQEFYEVLSPQPMLILATVNENERILPLAPIINALRRHVPEQLWLDIDRVWANQLVLLFPELLERRTDCNLVEMSQLPSARQHLFDALGHLLEMLAIRYGRVLFFLDDAQWVDQLTLQALLYWVQHGFFDDHGLLIIATQTEHATLEIDEFIHQIHHNHPVRVMDLPGLNPDELNTLIDQVLGEPALPTFSEQLFQVTQGNPFIALEILSYLLENSIDVKELQSLKELPLPDSLYGLIRNHLNQLTDHARLVLTAAAVIESSISLDRLRAVSALDPNDFLNAFDELIRVGFLHVNTLEGMDAGITIMVHERVRDVVINESPSAHLLILHQRVARHMSQEQRSLEKAAVIADHYRAGGEYVQAFNWYLTAAEHAWSLGGGEDALRNFQQAENLVKGAPQNLFNLQAILRLYHSWQDFAYQANRVDMLESIGVRLQGFLGFAEDPHVMGLSHSVLANACFMREDYETALVLAKTAVTQLEKAGDWQAFIQALFHQGMVQWWLLDFDGVLQTAERMLSNVQSYATSAEPMISSVFNARRLITETYRAQGEAQKAVDSAEMIYRELFNQLDTFDRLRAYNMLALAHFSAGDIADCLRFTEDGLEICQKLGNTLFEDLILMTLGKIEILQGHLDEAYQHATQALKNAEAENKIQSIIAAYTLLGDIFDLLGNTDQALQYYRLAQIRQGYAFQSYHGLENTLHLGRLLVRIEKNAEAREILQVTQDLTEEKGLWQIHAQALRLEGWIDLHEKNPPAAKVKFYLALRIAEQKGLAEEVLWGKFSLAFCEYAQKQNTEGETLLMEVVSSAPLQEMPMMKLRLLALIFQLLENKTHQVDERAMRLAFKSLVEILEVHTQSAALKQDFLNLQQIWVEKGYLS